MTNLSNFILEKLDSLVVVINTKGQITYVNPSVKKLLGFDANSFIGLSWNNAVKLTKDQKSLVKNEGLQVLKVKKQTQAIASFESEQTVIDAFGREKFIRWNLSLTPDNSWLGIGQDVTIRKRNENQLLSKIDQLKEKNKEVIDSINYSSRIQKAILPAISRFKSNFKDAFVLYKPKDIVSGDFYWIHEENNLVFVAAIDCTGHGVSGALMTVLANSLLRNCIRQGLKDPGEILKNLDVLLYEELNANNKEQTPDGMDIALCVFDLEKKEIAFSAAFRPLILIRNNEFIEFRASRFPIGLFDDIVKNFETQIIPYKENDVFYLFSDGYCDQFGGPKGKKFNKKSFKNLLCEIQAFPFDEQEGYLEYSFNNWKQNLEQVDDVLLMGIKV